jgi:cytochrome c oxidase cbb3-type subunit 3
MDDKWIYGSEPQQIFQTIVAGRPNGMPSFRMRLTDAEVWNLVAYVRTLGSLTENQARSSRDDHMKVTVNQMRRHVVEPKDTSGKRQ